MERRGSIFHLSHHCAYRAVYFNDANRVYYYKLQSNLFMGGSNRRDLVSFVY